MDRRDLLGGAAAVAAMVLARPVQARSRSRSDTASAGSGAARGRYRVLYNNDLTNILTCTSPYHPAGASFNPTMIDASVREVAGKVDVHLLSPGLCWVPLWQSKVVPPADHYRWVSESAGMPVDSIGRYVLNGGDVVARFVAACRANDEAPFISFRLNDIQHLEVAGQRSSAAPAISRFYVDNPQYRLGTGKNWSQLGQNWAIPAVRAYKFKLIEELCLNYDIDGLELDFQRYPSYFLDSTPIGQRAQIMASFVSDVRAALDRGARGGHRSLGVRVPAYVDSHAPLGIDLRAFVAAGVDIVTVSDFFLTSDEDDLAQIRSLASGAAVYNELTQATSRTAPHGAGASPAARPAPARQGGTVAGFGLDDLEQLLGFGNGEASPAAGNGGNGPPQKPGRPGFTRTTPAQLITGANNAYQQGAAGVSLFNFAYYRPTIGETDGPYDEPPFDVLPRLRDASFVASQPQWAVAAADFNIPKRAVRMLPQGMALGKQKEMSLTLFPPSGARHAQLRFRLRNASGGRWIASINGKLVKQTDNDAPIINDPFRANTAHTEGDYVAFDVPIAALRSGENRIVAVLGGGPTQIIDYIDLLVA